jgi:hypothetical protein
MHTAGDAIDISSKLHISIHPASPVFSKGVEAERMKEFHLDIQVVHPNLSRKITDCSPG